MMYGAQTGQVQLPVSHTQVDTTWFVNNLPQGNDVFPQIDPMGVNGNVLSVIVSTMRMLAQSRAYKSPANCFAYNLAQKDRFNNGIWTFWCQVAVKLFVAFNTKVNQETAILKACEDSYVAMVASLVNDFPAIRQQLSPEIAQAINEGLILARKINEAIGNARPVANNSFSSGHGQPMIGGMNPRQVNMNTGGFSSPITDILRTTAPPPPTAAISPFTSILERDSGIKADAFIPPIETITPSTIGAPSVDSEAVVTKPVITDIRQVVMDLDFCALHGAIDPTRPYDLLHNPEGICIRPYYQTIGDKEWELPKDLIRQINTDGCISFLVKFADGSIKEKRMASNREMDYLLHEIDDRIGRQHRKPNGIVVDIDDGFVLSEKSKPIVPKDPLEDLEITVHAGSIGASDPIECFRIIMQESEEDIKLPILYCPVKATRVQIDKAVMDRLTTSLKGASIRNSLQLIDSFSHEGKLVNRTDKLLRSTFTQAVVYYLKTRFDLEIEIDDAVTDYEEILDVLGNYNREYQLKFEEAAPSILRESLNLAVVDEEDTAIVDLKICCQLGVDSSYFKDIHLKEDEAVALGDKDSVLYRFLIRAINLASDIKPEGTIRLRLITSDFYSYEIYPAVFTKDTFLIRLVKD